jgi:uncharacterized Fe-S radical SAM superfamily protein PflX
MNNSYPFYLRLFENGNLQKKVTAAKKILEDCRVCPRNCRVNRVKGELGECRIGAEPIISSYFPHFGEEAPLEPSLSVAVICAACSARIMILVISCLVRAPPSKGLPE